MSPSRPKRIRSAPKSRAHVKQLSEPSKQGRSEPEVSLRSSALGSVEVFDATVARGSRFPRPVTAGLRSPGFGDGSLKRSVRSYCKKVLLVLAVLFHWWI